MFSDTGEGKVNNGPSGFTGETDRVTGEYHYRNGYTQRIYSDAHYVPEDESTAPPRYYTPPTPTQREPKPKKAKKKSGGIGIFAAFCMCLSCALVGGICGASISEKQFDEKLTALEERLSTESSDAALSELPTSSVAAEPVSNSDSRFGEVDPAAVYDKACRQVVGITTDVTYTNFFGMTSSSAVTGSGFFIREDGYILTNYHVIEYAYAYGYDIEVITHEGERYPAEIVGVEEQNDIAVLKIDIAGAVPVSVADSDSLKVGEELYAVGNPLGELEFSMTFGRVSALNRLISTEDSGVPINMFQFDAAVNSGNSGGPVYDASGRVVGVVTAKYSSSGVEGLGFAIPINDAVSIADELMTRGYVSGKAKLGISFDERYTSMYSRYYGLPKGAYVYSVEKDSCADKAGIRQGDIVTAIGDYTISSYDDIASAIKRFSAGDRCTVSFYRSGEQLTAEVVFDEYVPTGVKHS